MTVVADAGPIIHLSMIGSFDLLTALFGQIMVPSLALDEVTVRGAGLPGSAELSQADWRRNWREVSSYLASSRRVLRYFFATFAATANPALTSGS